MNHIEIHFPNLRAEGYQITSQQTKSYNCIAWAAGDNSKWWWPDSNYMYFWPDGIPRDNSLNSFLLMFGRFGFTQTNSSEYEEGFEKVAVYVNSTGVTHAARQLTSGKWTSKLGADHDIEHTLDGLNGVIYGSVGMILKRSAHN